MTSQSPALIEFAGLPGAGKTTVSEALADRLQRDVRRCRWLEEAAARSGETAMPEHKADWRFNVWTLCDTLARAIEDITTQATDVVVLDRGLMDVICWLSWFSSERGEPSVETLAKIEDFVGIDEWFGRIRLLVYLDVSLEEALARGKTPGRVVNRDVFQSLRTTYGATLTNEYRRPPRALVLSLDTRHLSQPDVVEICRHVSSVAIAESAGFDPLFERPNVDASVQWAVRDGSAEPAASATVIGSLDYRDGTRDRHVRAQLVRAASINQ